MNLNDIEKHINDSFGHFKPEVANEKIWEAIESDLPGEKKRKRRFVWIWFSVGVLLMSALIVSNLDRNEPQVALSNAVSEEMGNQNEVADQKDMIVSDDDEISVIDEETDVNDLRNKYDKHSSKVAESNGLFDKRSKMEKDDSDLISHQIDKLVNKEEMSFDLSKPDDKKRSMVSDESETHVGGRDMVSDELGLYTNKENVVFDKEQNLVSDESETHIESIHMAFNESESHAEELSVENDLQSEKEHTHSNIIQNRVLEGIDLLRTLKLRSVTSESDKNFVSGMELPMAAFVEKEKFSVRSGFLISAGIFQGFSKYENTSADPNLYQLRLDAEKVYENIQFSLKYTHVLSDKAFVNVGINYNHFQYSSRHFKTETERIEQTFNSIKRTSRTSIIRYGSDQSFYAPVNLGYRVIESSSWGLDLSIGYEFNIWSKHSGYEIDLNETEYDLALDSEDRLRDRNSDYITAGIFFNYRLNNKYHMLLGLEAKKHRHAIYNEHVGIKKSYDFMGLSLGLSRNFE